MFKIALLLALLMMALAQTPNPTIIYVSSSPSQISLPINSSLRGGRLIYIKAIGHNPVASENLVYVGTYPCIIPSDGVTDTFISCETSDTGLTTSFYNQAVTLISYGKTFTTTSPYLVHFRSSYTPSLTEIYPTSGFADSNVNLYGVHRVTNLGDGSRDMGDVVRLRLGGDVCSRFDVNQPTILADSSQSVTCKQSSVQQAGRYNVTEQMVHGFADKDRYLRRSSLTSEYFQFTALPIVTSFSPNSGNTGGQFLKIQGTGFSQTKQNNTVTVDGNNCEVTGVTDNQISCTLATKNSALSTLLVTNSSSQANGYVSGAGLTYQRFSLPSGTSLSTFTTAVRTANSSYLGVPQQSGFRAELKQGDYYGSYYGQVWKGYFTPLVSGTYTFRGTSDDIFQLFLATTYGSTELPATPLISANTNQVWNSFYATDVASAESSVTLDLGKSYYLQAYHINGHGTGNFKVEVDVPNNDITLPFQSYQVDKITTNTVIQPQSFNYTMTGAIGGIYELNIYRPTQTPVYNVKANVTYGCSAQTFINALSNFNSFNGYGLTVTRYFYDANNNTLPDSTNSDHVVYTVAITLMRPTKYQSESFYVTYFDGAISFTETVHTAHSPLMTGTFTLNIGGHLIDPYSNGTIPWNCPASTLQTAIRALGFGFTEVDQVKTYNSYDYSTTWIIKYREFVGAVNNILVSGAGLSGGSSTPTVTASTRRPYSSAITFSPIDYRFLSTTASNPNVLVKVNNVPSICKGNCTYTFNNLLQVSTLTKSGADLVIAINNPTTVAYAVSDIQIKVGDLPCAISASSTVSSVTCTMQQNNDTTPILIAGSVIPFIAIQPHGIVGLANTASPITVPLTTSAISLTSGGNNGGYILTITGSGFPLDKSKLTITVCNNPATIKTITNQLITFYMPLCSSTGSYNVNVAVGSLTASNLLFNYTDASLTAPTIISLTPNSANPGVKGFMDINGNGFGNDSSQLTVFLSNSTAKVYKLNIISFSNTSIRVGLPGGLPGDFVVQVNHPVNGDSISATANSNAFSYVVQILSISPTTGSYNGGTLITITGRNFSPDKAQTLAFVGRTLDWFCNIESITTTTILCRTPPISKEYVPGVGNIVVVATRLIVLNSCPGVCNFTYMDSASSPNLASISKPVTPGGVSITLTGTQFTSTNACSVSLTNVKTEQITVITNVTCTPTSAVFTIPLTVLSGNYDLKVRNSIGESNSQPLTVQWSVGTSTWSTGGSVAGIIANFTGGSGFPTTFNNSDFTITISTNTTNYPLYIISCCTDNIIRFELPAVANGTSININFIGPVNTITKKFTALSSLTPTATLISSTNAAVGFNTITINVINSTGVNLLAIYDYSLVSTTDRKQVAVGGNWTLLNTTYYSFTVTLNAGPYKLRIATTNGYFDIATVVNVAMPTNVVTLTQDSSYAGGLYTIAAQHLSPVSYIRVNGFKGELLTYTSTSAIYEVPALVTSLSQSTLGLTDVSLLKMGSFKYFSDQTDLLSNVSFAFDGQIKTIYGSPNTQCYIGIDIGVGLNAKINRIRFFPYLDWANAANYTLYSQFQGSNDQTTWTRIGLVDQTVHNGWNTILSESITPFRYIRFAHNSTSQCNLAEIELYGQIFSSMNVNMAGQVSDVVYYDGFNTITYAGVISYKQSMTPIIDTVNPIYGDIFGNYTLTLTGSNLNFDTAQILIDGIPCTNPTASSSSQLTCLVGARLNLPTTNTFTVTVGGKKAIVRDNFLYVLKWSDSRTWGVDQPPIDGDLVYVPQGMTLLVDQNTPNLQGIAVQNGTIVFDNTTNIVVQAGFIVMNGGRFIAGTERRPHHAQLTFILYGGYYGKQMPMFGNKGIGCMDCKLSMYGIPRTPTWTTISATINPGVSQFTVSEDVDWKVGEVIVVASTSFFHQQAERRTITVVSGRTITVDQAFVYKHVSVVETHGTSDKLEMRAEVGLLTRNIKMMGDQATSVPKKYGSHLMIAGKSINGAEGQVAYTEFTNCGQPQILGRYCIHFHMIGQAPTSFVRGNAVHDSFARVVTLHGVHFLTVQSNVGHRVRGHNFFVEDGIETKNIIRNNLAISSLQVTNMLQTDTSVASFWVTNPTNDFYGNHAAGSDFYGIWYEIKANPDGPSATNDVCPIGNTLGYVANNVAHSNLRFGLRIFKLYSRLYPCQDIRNDTNVNDPWAFNPSITSTFHNFTIYKNLQDGVLAQQTGNVIFNNFTIAQNYHSGVQFYLANFTREPPVVINSAIIGMSISNKAVVTTNYTNGMSAVITPRSGVTKFSNIRFYRYPVGSVLFRTCRLCDDPLKYTNVGTEVIVEKLTFSEVSGNYLFMIGLKRDVIYDLDASFSSSFGSGTRTSATIVSNFSHIASYNVNKCPQALNAADWDYAVMCDQTITIRRVFFTNLQDTQIFNAQFMKSVQLSNIQDVVDPHLSHDMYTNVSSLLPDISMQSKDRPNTWSLPFITGRIYNIWWGTGLDFSHLAIATSPIFTTADVGIIFKFNNTENRQLFKVGPIYGDTPLVKANYINQSTGYLNNATCKNGDYYHNNDNSTLRMFTICQSGKNRQPFEYTDVNGIICDLFCPAPAGVFIRQSFVRLWSNASQWPGNVVPKAGDNVYVNGNWTVLLDIDPAAANELIIDGTLVVDDTRDVNITAKFIFIRAGNLTVGRSSLPFTHKFTIQLNGNKGDKGSVVDPVVAGNKLFVVTGTLNLFGVRPSTVTTYLKQTALANSNIIWVGSSTDWAVGDQIALAPSFSASNEYQIVTIQAINTDGSLTVTPLKYTHYGSNSVTITSSYGNLDTRTRIGHLNRNIQIVPGPDSGFGFSVVVYGFLDGFIKRVGAVVIDGVQFLNGGQLDSTNSPLVFKYNAGGNYTSKVTGSSFVNCKAFCINADTAQNVSITNNVLYNAWVFGIQVIAPKSFTFSNNVIIGVTARPTMASQLIACISILQYVDPAFVVAVKDNFCQGSQGHGFALPHIKCSQLETNPFANNTIGSASIGFIFNTISTNCQAFSYAKAYACKIGQISGPPSSTDLVFSHFVMADNGRSVTLKLGANQGGSNHTAVMSYSYISAVSRPTCAQCYGSQATDCSDSHGIRLFTVSANGEIMPGKFGSGFDVVCKQQVFDNKAFLYNVTFDNFKQIYNGTVNGICKNNFMFRPHTGASDSVGGHSLFNCSVNNSDTLSYLLSDAPNPNFLGWFGGCGDIMCTGKQNYLIQDFTGTFLGFKGIIVPNNTDFAVGQGCTEVPSMNGHICNRQDLATLQYQSTAPDFNTRIMWPVSLTYDGANYTTVTNGWREWQWLGKQPQNKRFGRFMSIVRLNQVYNMTFSAMPPVNLQLQIQKRTPQGNNSNYVVVKLHYPLPNSIRVQVRGTEIAPILLTELNSTTTGLPSSINTSICGSNAYFYDNYTIHFVVTQDLNCLVDISITESVQLTTHFSMPIANFFMNGQKTNFINSLCALLNIRDTSRVKIVGVFTGSTTVVVIIGPTTTDNSTNSTNSTNSSTEPSVATVAAILSSATSSGALLSAIANGSAVLGSAYQTSTFVHYTLGSTPDQQQKKSSVGLIAGATVAGVVILIGIVITVLYCIRKRAKVVEQIRSSEQQFHHDKEMQKQPSDFIMNNSDIQNIPHYSNFKINNNNEKELQVKDIENGMDE